MKRLWRTSIVLLTPLLGCLGGLRCGHAQAAPVWQPDPAMTARLGPDVALEHCAFRPPVGYKLQETTSFASGRKLYKFVAPQHFAEGGTHLVVFAPTIFVTTETDQTELADWTVIQGVSELVQEYADKMINGDYDKITHSEIGLVGGRPALRRYAKGDWDLDARMTQFAIGSQGQLHRVVPVRLLIYGIGDSRRGTLIVAYDMTKYASATLPLMEAAVLTLRQTDPAPVPVAQAPQTPPDPSQPAHWTPRPNLLRFLGPETVTHGLVLHLPLGYEPVTMSLSGKPAPTDPILFGWKGPGPDLLPLLRVTATPLPANQPPPSLQKILAHLADAEGTQLEKYVHSPPEVGLTGFGPTGRFYAAGNIRFAGTVLPKSLAVYVFLTPKYLVQIEAISASPDSAPEIHVMEAAILTGHRAQ